MTLLVDAITRHQVNVQRFADGEARKALPILRELAKDLRARIQAGNATAFQAGRMIQLETEIRQIVGMRVSEMQMALDLEDFASREMSFTTRLLEGYVTADLAAGFQSDMAANIVTQSQMRMLSGSAERMVTIPQLFDELSEAAGRQSMQLVQAGVIEGRTTDEIARDVYRGITNRTRQQVTSVTRTAINHIGSQARQEVYNANSDIMEGERFLATLDARTTITCASFDREVFEIGQGPIPPLHFGCVLPDCNVTPSGGVAYVTKRPFDGEVVVIRTLGNRELTVTGNHPVMTNRGFIPAKLIQQGDRVVSRLGTDSLRSRCDDDQVKSVIEDRFDALLCSGRMRPVPVPYAPEDFHGDVTEDEVGVVLVDRELSDAMVSTLAHQFVKRFLKVARPGALVGKSTGRQFAQFVIGFYMTPRCGVSFGGEASDLIRRRIIHAGLLLLGPIARLDSVSAEHPVDDGATGAELLSNAGGPSASIEHGNDQFGVNRLVAGLSADIDTELSDSSIADRAADSSYVSDFRRLIPLAQEFDTVSDVSSRRFSGHVFNLMCGDGVYSASGIITHNCRSIRMPVVKPEFRRDSMGERASMDGPVSNQTTYGGWLKGQSEEFQNDVLGPQRAQLFRSGKVKIDRFTDSNGRVLTLDELSAREGIEIN